MKLNAINVQIVQDCTGLMLTIESRLNKSERFYPVDIDHAQVDQFKRMLFDAMDFCIKEHVTGTPFMQKPVINMLTIRSN